MRRTASCVTPEGTFTFGIHKPAFTVTNQREGDYIESLGRMPDGTSVDNRSNFPDADHLEEAGTSWIYEIRNPLPFRGATFIKKDWADARADDPASIALPPRDPVSMSDCLGGLLNDPEKSSEAFRRLPEPVLLALAVNSTDPRDLEILAGICCRFSGSVHRPDGLEYQGDNGRTRPQITHPALFEALVNNPHLPDQLKKVMVLRPGTQGGSEIIGEVNNHPTHIYEYLRRNSYIAWGHYAANMAEDAVRYRAAELTSPDMTGLRHLYYQRTYLRLGAELGLTATPRQTLEAEALEALRLEIIAKIRERGKQPMEFTATLWGWNYGFDLAPSGYRLHASHQQIHQQFALLPESIENERGERIRTYGCGDLVSDHCQRFRREHRRDFFDCYLSAVRRNTRMDGRQDRPASLIIHQDEQTILLVPKAQTSQWEIQLICLKPVGNILEADGEMRQSLDRGIHRAIHILAGLGAEMVTTIEFPKRFDDPNRDQRLIYSFLPRLPESPGAFSEAQLRYINGHYPEDFAAVCREVMAERSSGA